MKGKILSVIAGIYDVYLDDGSIIKITPKGKFRHLKIKPSVGDNVIVKDYVIDEILPRKNILIRPSISNLDLGIIVVSCQEPKFSSYLLDKFLTLLNMNNIEPLVILSKVDLVETQFVNNIIKEYSKINVKVVPFSKYNPLFLSDIKEIIKNKTIAFMGQTGVGKSSLINVICPEFSRKEGEYSLALNRGKHQTKEVIIFPFGESFIADTPGFSSLELFCYKEDLKEYFPFFRIEHGDCFYKNCLHLTEPKCAVKNSVPLEHYQNYLQILEELKFRKDRFK